MRKFKFVGDPSDYKRDRNPPIVGSIYLESDMFTILSTMNVLVWFDRYPNDWQEVFEPTLEDKIQELKTFAKGQGLSVDVTVDKVDIWDGVEFVECVKDESDLIGKGRVLKIIRSVDIYNTISIYSKEGEFINMNKKYFKPSTESAYVEQLKKEAFERFGEIKEGDRFERNFGISIDGICTIGERESALEFRYFKCNDSLEFCGSIIYSLGKWATRLSEKVKVVVGYGSYNNKGEHIVIRPEFTVKNISRFDFSELNKQIGKFIEDYLNKKK